MIGKRVQEVRDHFNLSRKSFGEKFFVSQDVINNIERERVVPTDNNIKAICKTYNVNEHWLRTGEGEMFNDEQPPSLDALAELNNLDDLSRAIIEEYIQMPEGARKSFLDLVHAVAEKVRKAQYLDATSEAVAHRILEEDVFSGMKNAPAADKPQAK